MNTREEFDKFMKSVAYRMDALRDFKESPDPEYMLTPEQFLSELKADHAGKFSYVLVYPNWANGKVVGLDMDVIWNGLELPVRFITQNPDKRKAGDQRYLNEYAKLVREGHSIVWVMKREGKEREAKCSYMGCIKNGVYNRISDIKKINGSTVPPGRPDNMRDYVLELRKELPHVPHQHIVQFVEIAGKIGILKQ